MIDRQTKQFISKNRTKTKKHTGIIVTNWQRSLSISRSPVAAVATVIIAIVVVAAIVEEEVAVGSPLDNGEVLKLLNQPVDPEGETLQGQVLVHIMMCFDVEGLANTLKLSEGAPEQLGGELIIVEERFLIGVLGHRLLPLLQLLPTAAFVVVVLPSSPLRRRWAI
jgi:hypothetical protein